MLEALEDRRLLATFNVTTTADSGAGSLREAIVSANANSDFDEITFASSLNGGTIRVNSELPHVLHDTWINGPGADQLTLTSTLGGDFGALRLNNSGPAGLDVTGLTIEGFGNSNSIESGGINAANAGGVLFVDGVAFRGNVSNDGAGIRVAYGATATILNSEFSGNRTTFIGSAISVRDASATLENVTISGNTGGPVIRNRAADGESSDLMILNSTIAFNSGTATETSQLGTGTATTEIVNSILAKNSGDNFANLGSVTQTSLGSNISDDFTGNLSSAGDQRGVDPRLGSLADNGGPTRTHALLEGSPAIDAGNENFNPFVDQRGEDRDQDGDGNGVLQIDIGAYELQTIVVSTALDVVDGGDSVTSLREAITQANADPDEDLIIFDPALNGQPITLTIDGSAENQNARGDLDFETGVATLRGNGPENTIISGGGDNGIGENVISLIAGAEVTIEGVTVRDGRGTNGGGIAALLNSSGSLDLIDVVLTGNEATSSGGGLVVSNTGNVTIRDSTISGNTAGLGGGVSSQGKLTIERTTIDDNTASVGGAIQIQDPASELTILASTLSNNKATLHGGALANINATATIRTSTISGNEAAQAGGAIFNAATNTDASAMTTVREGTITDNTSGSTGNVHAQSEGGGISSVVELKHVILVGNDGGTAPDNITFGNVPGSTGATVTSLGQNLFDDDGFGIPVPADLANISVPVIDPLLENNGGPTLTHALVPGSPAIDAGDNTWVLPSTIVRPVAVVTDAPTFAALPVDELLSMEGLTVDNYATTNDSSSNIWASDAPNGDNGDYFANDTPNPVLDFHLDGTHQLTDIVIWGYLQSSRNDVQRLTVETSSDGGETFSDPIELTKPRVDQERISTLSLGGTFAANFVRVTLADNYYEEGQSGGDRVGLAEVRFLTTGDQRGESRISPGAPNGTENLDIGAVEFQYVPTPDILILGNGTPIANGGATPSAADNTLFPRTPTGTQSEQLFTIRNEGDDFLFLTQADFGNMPEFFFTSVENPIAPGADSVLGIGFFSEVPGTFSTTLTLTSTDPDEQEYSFALQATAFVVPDIVVTETGDGTSVSEMVGTDTFEVSLSEQPTSDVVVDISGVDLTEIDLDLTTLTFTPSNWDQPQTVTVTGIDDRLGDGDITSILELSINQTLSDDGYELTPNQFVSAVTIDDDLTSVVGEGLPIDNRMPTLDVSYVIALQGIFPSQDGSLSEGEPLLAEVRPTALDFAPRGYAFAEGQLLEIAQNSALFVIVGTLYGGDGVRTFALPDLRGRVPVGAGPGLAVGTQFGTDSITLDGLPFHTHTLPESTETTTGTGNGNNLSNVQPSLALTPIVARTGVFEGVGEVVWFAGNFVPSGEVPADGRLLAIADHTALFSQLGTTYGGDGETTFAVPDLFGRTIIGAGDGPGLTPRTIGEEVGEFNTFFDDIENLPAHTHDAYGETTGSTGAGVPLTNMQPSVAMQYVIAVTGTFPSRNRASGERSDSSRAIGGDTFLGHIGIIAGNQEVPRNFAAADGRLLQISQNSALFSLLGTQFGGDGEVTFALPDLRGRAASMSAGGGTSVGTKNGTEDLVMTAANLPPHQHSADRPAFSWTNETLSVDVNRDGSVTPIDALQVLNQLNSRTFTVNGGNVLVDPGTLAEHPGRFFDTNGDGNITPIDALRVLNYIRANQGGGGEGEASTGVPGFEDDDDDGALAAMSDLALLSLLDSDGI